ncbi:hypothetical protein GPECTOR_367g148 [Gonium pectorale]|uniref:COR domain-containing protein n=1 Tax=Gonium pectorale TaxID=33097 RepID=A0A150FVI4_GONPE|nr:hypothetical protein GPECTOR_367g148 [Gonium pectorale]|eukprot:KXZ41606.1 hypothetical protein GPECTOR_367g148 [Gonium pectorale]
MMKELLAAGADVNAADKVGETPLHVATSEGHLEVVKELLAARADVNATDKDERTPLHFAASKWHLEVVKELLAAGADVKAANKDAATPLHVASAAGRTAVVEALLKAGASHVARMSNGFTPLHSACEGGHRDAVRELLRAGADHTLVSWDGKTPLDVAGSRGVKGLVELLRQHAADRSSAVQVAARSSLVLVGPGGAGKTTLAVRLVTGRFEKPNVTHGLIVHEWLVPEQLPGQPPLLFSIWDLGGQDVYLSTHVFFMVREALYIMVYNSRDHQKDNVGEYLDRVKLLVPGEAPLLLVATHACEGGFEAQEPPAPVLEAHCIGAETFIRLSSETGQGVEQLKQAIVSAATKMSGPSDWLSQENLKVREEVRHRREDLVSTGQPPLIPLGELEEVAKRVSIAAPQDLRRCMDRLTDMGELRHFSDVPGLEDVVVIDPRWLADLMATFVTTNKDRVRELGLDKGRTTMEALQKVLESECPPSTGKAPGLVRLMQHCGLVYASPDGTALVPPMLPDRMKQRLGTLRDTLVEMSSESLPEPRRWWSAQYQYGRLPDNRLSRLLCRLLLLLPDAEVLDVWRFGALLRRPQRAVLALTCSRSEKAAVYTLHVAVCSPAPELLGARVSALLGEELDGMEMTGIQYECPSCLEKHPKDKQGTYKANVLRSRAQKKRKLLECSQCDAELPLAPFIRALTLDEQAAPWSPEQLQGASDGGRRLRHLQAGIELLADLLAAAAGGQGQQRQGGPPDAGGGGLPPLPELGEPELREARRDLVRRAVAVHRLVSAPEMRGHLPLLVALLPPSPPPPHICDDGAGGAGSSGSPPPPPLRLHPVCEHPEGPHPVEGHPGYDIPPLYDDPAGASWLRTHARGLRPLMRAMELMWRHGPQEAQGPAGSGEAGQQAANLQALIKRLEQEESEAHLSSCQPGSSTLPEGGGDKPGELDLYVSCQEARSSIETLLEEGERKVVDGGRSLGPLRRVVSRSGAVMWLCPCHADKHVW